MNLHACEKAIAPGTVVFITGQSSSADSTWGVTVPYDYWASRSARKAVATFAEYSRAGGRPQIPLLHLDANFEWQLCFKTFLSDVKPMCPLDQFLGELGNDNLNSVRGGLWACSHRDGSRYYAELSCWLHIFARAAAEDLSEEVLRGHPALRLLHRPGLAIRAWRAEEEIRAARKAQYVPTDQGMRAHNL